MTELNVQTVSLVVIAVCVVIATIWGWNAV
jgi:hypothetical protein